MPNLREWDITLNTSGGFSQILNFLDSYDKMPFFCPLPPFKALFESAKKRWCRKKGQCPFVAGVSASLFLSTPAGPCTLQFSLHPPWIRHSWLVFLQNLGIIVKKILNCGPPEGYDSQLYTFPPGKYAKVLRKFPICSEYFAVFVLKFNFKVIRHW